MGERSPTAIDDHLDPSDANPMSSQELLIDWDQLVLILTDDPELLRWRNRRVRRGSDGRCINLAGIRRAEFKPLAGVDSHRDIPVKMEAVAGEPHWVTLPARAD
jgi:hypothetical protein